MRFRKKPVVIEAWKFDSFEGYPSWMGDPFDETTTGPFFHADGERLSIPTLEGEMIASRGDWIIRGVQGELYPCKPDIFEQTYEQVFCEDEIRKAEEGLEPLFDWLNEEPPA